MEKEPKNPEAPAGAAAASGAAEQGILRELGQEVKEQVRPNQGYLKLDYFTLFWLFVAGCVVGLVVETAFHAIVYGGLESRAGLVWGPFSPIYGVGAVVLTASLNRFYHSHNLIIFLVAMAVGSVIEYATSWLMEVLWGAIAWDYSGTFGSINGRTNFAFGVMWGLLGLLWVRMALPFIRRIFSHVDARALAARLVTAALSAFLAVDIVATVLALDREGQRAAGVPATTWTQEFFDEHFPDSFLQARMQNMSVYGRE
ncbi:putative ABC transporter permease [Arabiibacter massiliensis]|uniref:putative ABC transporter permease n=1 Tax=Arabiibacter massiliensis TaxID=1870985 RepID=UPI0009BA5B05|nr:putative ABC transporter permease [Arabiibacter massiliensis]